MEFKDLLITEYETTKETKERGLKYDNVGSERVVGSWDLFSPYFA